MAACMHVASCCPMRSRVSSTRNGSNYDLAVARLSQECAKTFVQMWRESPGHMTNMMSSNPMVSVTSDRVCLWPP